MGRRSRVTWLALASGLIVAVAGFGQTDPRTAAGQIEACGGAVNWQGIGFIEFSVAITGEQPQGPWQYRWDRHGGFIRFTGPGVRGEELDVAVEINSRTGGGWADGKQLLGRDLADAVNWVVERFSQDVLWLVFPLEWSAGGVTVTPGETVVKEDGSSWLSTGVASSGGRWMVLLDPGTGRIHQSTYAGSGTETITVSWSGWEPHGGVYFATRHEIQETGETVSVVITRVAASAPLDAF